jgi:transcription antitermination factor NusA-like protein
MKTIQELNDKKIPIVRIDNSLEKYVKMPIFQNKVDKANEMLRTIGLPKIQAK